MSPSESGRRPPLLARGAGRGRARRARARRGSLRLKFHRQTQYAHARAHGQAAVVAAPRRVLTCPHVEPRTADAPPALRVDRRRGDVRRARDGGGLPLGARRLHAAARQGVRLVARAGRRRGLGQPHRLRPRRAVRRRDRAALRRPQGHDVRALPGRRRGRALGADDGAVAALPAVGRRDRLGHGRARRAARGDHRQHLVLDAARPRQRPAHGLQRERSADLPAAARVDRVDLLVALDGRRRRDRGGRAGDPARDHLPAPLARRGRASCPTARPRRRRPRRRASIRSATRS